MQNFNSVTQSLYSLSNQDHLEEHKNAYALSSNEWAGFRQWLEVGRKVKKGAKGCKIFMVCEKKIEQEDGDNDKKRQVVKSLYVFNKDHTEEL
ncbi:TPA: DUF1738 domain-containing protein [Vibrio cholerae]|uniref:DUF1738 domain-containing protein n=1 Tax=Vibrio cholerae TaxID=666 RepID=A0ABD7SRN8_VIBCL|nr:MULTISPECIES: ArdC family protein [Vibrio]HAS6017086.1 ArdC family protein [Vibrio cholerae O1]EGQ9333567.1 DUF1738 domain-containing protein [Vibrio cholerae]EGR1049096.1 DUF1738 domain-containing protein [Vibrio cholerae]EGR3963627.1 DUF1738 domain-containing protein [Vibrio cholerae]EGR4347807.1 DUF1738 domain-containing protein [Vibrio cholerae]